MTIHHDKMAYGRLAKTSEELTDDDIFKMLENLNGGEKGVRKLKKFKKSAYVLRSFAHTTCMSKRKSQKEKEELMNSCASANECTGLLQKVTPDPDEVEEFHKMYNGLDGRSSTK